MIGVPRCAQFSLRSVFFCAASLLAAATASSAVAGDVEDARALREEGRLHEALTKLGTAAADTKNVAAAIESGLILESLGRYDDAVACLTACTAAVPDDVSVWTALASTHLEAAEWQEMRGWRTSAVIEEAARAAPWIARLLRKDPESNDAWVARARLLRQQRGADSPEVERSLQDVVARAPKHHDALFELGRTWFRRGQAEPMEMAPFREAEKYFRAAFDASGRKSGRALFMATRANAWRNDARSPEANLVSFERAAALMPGNEDALKEVYDRCATDAQRIGVTERLYQLSPTNPRRIFRRALALQQAQQPERVAGILAAERARTPGSAIPELIAGQLRECDKDAAGTVAAYCAAIRLLNGRVDHDVYDPIDIFACRSKLPTPEQRDQIWTAFFESVPGEVQGIYNAGVWWRDSGHDAKRSLVWLQRAKDAAPGDCAVWNDIGVTYSDSGLLDDPKKAEGFFRKAIELAVAAKSNDPAANLGYRLAISNLSGLLVQQKRARDLRLLADKMLKDDPVSYATVVALADSMAGKKK